jgi:ketosteroid isomerase-like protein
MSEENVEIVRKGVDAFNRGDYEEALAVLDQDVEWHVPDVAALDAPASGMVRGRKRVAEVFARWLGAWDPFSFEVTEILGHGEQVFLAGLQVGRGRHSGLDVSVPTFHVCTLRDRRIVVDADVPRQSRRPRCRRAVGVALWTRSAALHGKQHPLPPRSTA